MASDSKPTPLQYRADIQGMRAIAVTMVLLFHFQLLGAQGGFAGVDVFFVISGYLMTSILFKQRDEPGPQLLKRFLAKRLWRIAPAYLCVILFTLLAGWFAFLPLDYARLAESALSSVVFISNHYFENQAGYFEDVAIYKPLLHTWSLAVEMQFYLVWPLTYLLVRRLSNRLQGLVLLATMVAFFGLAFALGRTESEIAFFSLPTRIWQFAAGALLVNPWTFALFRKLPVYHGAVQTAAIAALVLSTFGLSEQLPWPAPWALIPTLATVLLIAGAQGRSGQPGTVAKLLSVPVMQWIGKISYSLYLVHWPVVCIIFSLWWPAPPAPVRIAALLLSIALGWLLFHHVENRFRQGLIATGSTVNWRKMAAITTPVVVLLIAVGIWSTSGMPVRFPAPDRPALLNQTPFHAPLPSATDCLTQNNGCATNSKPTVFVWGDSHARQYRDGLGVIAGKSGYDFSYQFYDGCPPGPGLGTTRHYGQTKQRCAESNAQALRKIDAISNLQTVILIARWTYYVSTLPFADGEQDPLFTIRGQSNELSAGQSVANIESALTELIVKLQQRGTTVIFIQQTPEFKTDPARCMNYARYRNIDTSKCSLSRAEVEQRQSGYRQILAKLAATHSNVQLVETINAFCTPTDCSPTLNGQIAYLDDDHILDAAALQMLENLPPILKPVRGGE